MKLRTLTLLSLAASFAFVFASSADAQTQPSIRYDSSIMDGSPPPTDKRITLTNWQTQPFNHWAFMHMEQVMRTALVDRGTGPVALLATDPRSLAGLKFKSPTGDPIAVGEALVEINCNGYLLIQDGKIVFEYYANGFRPGMRHLTQSAGKSFTGTLAASLIHDGVLDEDKLVTDYVPEMKNSAYAGATVRQVLNMTAGVKYSEDYYDPKAEVYRHEISHAWKPAQEGVPATLYDFLPTLTEKERAHGSKFEYCSAHTDLLAWIMERATGKRLNHAMSERIWSRLGAENDLMYTVDSAGTACANGGLCVSLRDFGRFGQMMLQNGFYNGQQIVPGAVVADCFTGNHEKFKDSAKGALLGKEMPSHFNKGGYQNQWWAMDVDGADRTLALGSFGNLLYIDRERNIVMAQLATQRVNADIPTKRLEFAMLSALFEELGK